MQQNKSWPHDIHVRVRNFQTEQRIGQAQIDVTKYQPTGNDWLIKNIKNLSYEYAFFM